MSTTKTNFPGMNSNAGMQGNNPQGPSQMTQFPGMGSNFNKEKRPILGFLYSVSRTPYGEYWPLFVGSNPVGRGSNNAICLKESSVSDNHATIVVRRMQNKGESEGIFVFVQDTGSMIPAWVVMLGLTEIMKHFLSGMHSPSTDPSR